MSAVSNSTASAATPAADQHLDARGLNCPLPVLKTKVLLGRMQPGQVLRVTATDPHARIDFEAYCARSGHELLSIRDTDGTMEFLIRRAQEPKRI
jgi:tRNA 2-thiouridine synthesizing protein A